MKDQYGNPLPGAQVTFTVTAGEGKLSGQFTVEQATTDANGRAERTLTLGPGPGTYTLVRVSDGRRLVIFSVGTPADARSRAGDYRTWHLPNGVIARLSKGGILDIAYSADGTRLAVGSSIGVWVYNALTGAELDFLTGHTSEVLSVAFNPDGSTLASGSQGGTIRLWNATTGQHLNTLTGHQSAVNSIAFNPDGSTLASGSQGGTIRLWNATTGQHLRELTTQDLFRNADAEIVNSIAFSPEGSTLASSGTSFLDNVIRLWDADTGQHLKTIRAFGKGELWSVAFSPDGSRLVGINQVLPGWNLSELFNKRDLSRQYDVLDGGDIYLWDADTGRHLKTLDYTNLTFSYWAAFSPEGNTLVSGGEEFPGKNNIDLWDADTEQYQKGLSGHSWPVRKVAFSPEGKRFASGGGEELLLWDATRLSSSTVTGHNWLGRSVAFSADGTLASGGWGDTIDLWDLDTGQHLETISFGYTPTFIVRSVAFNPDGSKLAIAVGSSLRLWDVVTGQHKKNLIENRSTGQGSGVGIGIGGFGFGDTSGGLTGIRVGASPSVLVVVMLLVNLLICCRSHSQGMAVCSRLGTIKIELN